MPPDANLAGKPEALQPGIAVAALWRGDGSSVRAGLVAVMALTGLIYARSLSNEFVFDDNAVLAPNPYMGQWSFLWKSFVHDAWWFSDPSHLPQSSYYRPLIDVWRALNLHLFGHNPAGWHAAMIALHVLVVWLVFRTASILTGDRTAGLLAAALFGLMPVHAEAVAWAAAVSYPMSAAFELGAFEFYLRSRPGGELGSRRLAISLLLFAGALLCQESAVTFPGLIAAYAFIFSNEEMDGGAVLKSKFAKSLVAVWPYVIELAAYFVVRFWVLGFISRMNPVKPPNVLEIILTIPGAIANNLMLLAMFWITGPAHRLEFVTGIGAPGFYVPVAVLAALCGAGFILLKNHPRRRIYSFCAAWILIALAPMLDSGGLLASSLIQDRYLYLPSFGFCVIAADLAIQFGRENEPRRMIVGTGAAVLLGACAVLLLLTLKTWRDEVALFSRGIEEAPEIEYYHNRLAVAFAARGDFADARKEFNAAVGIDPNDTVSRYSLALVEEDLGDRRAAEETLAAWVKMLKPPYAGAYAELAIAADAAGDKPGVEAALKQAEALSGGAGAVALARAKLAYLHGDSKGAERLLDDLLRREPDDGPALLALGKVLVSDKRFDDALAVFRHAQRIAPGEPSLHYKIAAILHQLGRDSEARGECAQALEVSPDNPSALALMAEIERHTQAQ